MVLRFLLDSPARIVTAAITAAVLAGACADAGMVTGPQFATHQGKQPIHRIYRLGVGDKLKVEYERAGKLRTGDVVLKPRQAVERGIEVDIPELR